MALERRGEPRLTQDVDLTLLTGFGTEEEFVDALREEVGPSPAARAFALNHRVLLAQAAEGGSVDMASKLDRMLATGTVSIRVSARGTHFPCRVLDAEGG